jgi:hypothetical protein
MKTVTRDCGHPEWADMLGAPCLECRLQKTLEAGVMKIRAAYAGVPLQDLPVMSTARPGRTDDEGGQ